MKTAQVGLLAVLCLLGLIGGAVYLRAPEPAPAALPQAAESPVALPDGGVLYVQKHELSVAEWNACHEAGGCDLGLRVPEGQSAETLPATGLSHADVAQYLAWITASTGHDFRLPTAAEWAAMARDVLPLARTPHFTDPALAWASTYSLEEPTPRALRPRGSFSTSPEGVADLDGNVWEWTRDCYSGSAPPSEAGQCAAYLLGGEHLAAMFFLERDPARGGCAVGTPPAHLGARLVSDTAW